MAGSWRGAESAGFFLCIRLLAGWFLEHSTDVAFSSMVGYFLPFE